MDFFNQFQLTQWLTPDRITAIIRFLLTLIIGIPLMKVLTKVIIKLIKNYLTVQSEMLAKRFIWYVLLIMVLVSALNQLGFKLSALLGAAGIFGVAIGFASQTSFSNLISGMFMISEKSFSVGDTIQVGSTVGVVLSIDLLSVKLRTFDNRFVRIPNENMIKSELTNISRFPIRRTDIMVGVAYHEDLNRVIDVLKNIIADNAFALHEPSPLILVDSFGDSSVNIKLGVWSQKENIINLSNSIRIDIHNKFRQENIEIPFPYRTLTFSGDIPGHIDKRN